MSLIAPLTLANVIVIALYAIVGLISFRRLIPRLSTHSRRLALAIFGLHAFVSLIALRAADDDAYLLRLFHLDMENNLATAVAGMQFALAAQLALLTACFTRERPALPRMYWLGFGLLFFYFSWGVVNFKEL